jgi:hypothetical protein
MNVDVSDAATVICDDWCAAAASKTAASISDLNFAAGYLQATSNLTGECWTDQLTRGKNEMAADG